MGICVVWETIEEIVSIAKWKCLRACEMASQKSKGTTIGNSLKMTVKHHLSVILGVKLFSK